jgi:hypothetical protein
MLIIMIKLKNLKKILIKIFQNSKKPQTRTLSHISFILVP